MCLSENSMKTPGFEADTSLKYTDDEQLKDKSMNSYSTAEMTNEKVEMNVPPHEEPKRYAKIHDFCFPTHTHTHTHTISK